MSITKQIAKHLKTVYFGGNWTEVNLKDTLQQVTWQQANKKIYEFNTIVALTYHVNYFVDGVCSFLEGNPLLIKDKLSFDHPSINLKEEWENLLTKLLEDGNRLTSLIEQLPDSKLLEDFVNPKYGNYYSNLHGIIEHIHYHLGQIVLLKKIIIVDENA